MSMKGTETYFTFVVQGPKRGCFSSCQFQQMQRSDLLWLNWLELIMSIPIASISKQTCNNQHKIVPPNYFWWLMGVTDYIYSSITTTPTIFLTTGLKVSWNSRCSAMLLIIHYIRVIEEQLLLLICHSGIRSSFLVLGNQTERFFKFIPFASWHGIVTQYQ